MRGDDLRQDGVFSYLSPDARVPQEHPLRLVRQLVDTVLVELSPEFGRLYAKAGRPSIAPEKLLRALLLQVLYTVRSERLLMEQLDYNLLFRWFVGLTMDDPVWDATTFSKNRHRLVSGQIAQRFFVQVLAEARQRGLLSDEHFTVDSTMIEAWAGAKSFRRKDRGDRQPPDDPGNPTVNFRGEVRTNATHASTTDPDARLARKGPGREARLSYRGHVLMENRHGLVVAAQATPATGRAERETAVALVERLPGHHRITVGADKGYDTAEFVEELRDRGITPHVAQNTGHRASAVDARTTRHPGYTLSQRRRKRVEEIFGWLKTVGLMRKTRYRGEARVNWMFVFAAAAYNLVRIRNLVAVSP